MTKSTLLEPAQIGPWQLTNRVVMAPMTRSRAEADWGPSQWAAEYYAQRSSAGIVICEATQVGPDATGYPRTPGLWTDQHVKEWSRIVDGIHAGGAKAILQFWHCGRIAHLDNMPEGCEPIAPSAIRPATPIYTDVAGTEVESPIPREMTEEDIWRVVEDYRRAGELAKQAGFDGVEVHGANGYLIEQFAASNTNHRQDAWGGTLEKRVRFLGEILEAMAKVYDRDRIGLRLSPYGTFNDIHDENPKAQFEAMLHKAEASKIGYVHIIRPRVSGDEDRTASNTDTDVVAIARKIFSNAVIAAGAFTCESADSELESGRVDMVAFGRPFVGNPDLIERMRKGTPLTPLNQELLYTTGPEGYIDYPTACS